MFWPSDHFPILFCGKREQPPTVAVFCVAIQDFLVCDFHLTPAPHLVDLLHKFLILCRPTRRFWMILSSLLPLGLSRKAVWTGLGQARVPPLKPLLSPAVIAFVQDRAQVLLVHSLLILATIARGNYHPNPLVIPSRIEGVSPTLSGQSVSTVTVRMLQRRPHVSVRLCGQQLTLFYPSYSLIIMHHHCPCSSRAILLPPG